MSFFSSEDTLPDVDVTIILGIFSIDMNIHPKMLLLHFSGMFANVKYSVKRRNEIANELYHQLCPIAGRQGYEVVRRGGSSGETCLQSDQDLLDCIHDVPGLCPRKLRGVVILRGLSYYLIYRNVDSTKFVCHQYSSWDHSFQHFVENLSHCFYSIQNELWNVDVQYLVWVGIHQYNWE